MRVIKLMVALGLLWTTGQAVAQDTTEFAANDAVAADSLTDNAQNVAPTEKPFDAGEVIMHHIKDSHSWHFYDRSAPDGSESAVAIPLPIILYTDGHLDIFMSSAFDEGKKTVRKDNREYILHHDKIYLAENGQLKHDEHGAVLNEAPLDLSITKNVASLILSAILLLWIFIATANGYKKMGQVPTGLRRFTEPLILFVKDEIAVPNLGEEHYRKYLPYLLTLFFFIWVNNMLGLLPMGANLTGNIAVTLLLAVFTFIITNFSGSKHYWKEIVRMPGVPLAIQPIMTVIEFIGLITKPFSLMIRLFANITAGHIIVLSFISLIFIFKSVLISPVSIVFVLFMDVLELLVAALQAYIFTMLTAMYIGMAVKGGEE
ncbi:MAG: F0F1 ATP synthase subunit A [Salinivirgaceae bacterium]|nr:F0F1 ATP synthase subunit A [Salinivirgaceae bacterium]